MAENMPTEQKVTKPRMAICVHGELSAGGVDNGRMMISSGQELYVGSSQGMILHTAHRAHFDSGQVNHLVNEWVDRSIGSIWTEKLSS